MVRLRGLHSCALYQAFSALAAMDGAVRFAEPEEIARAILFPASEDAAMITGVELPVDGGFVL